MFFRSMTMREKCANIISDLIHTGIWRVKIIQVQVVGKDPGEQQLVITFQQVA